MRDHIHPATHRTTVLNGNIVPRRSTGLYLRLACGLALAALSASAVAQAHFCIAGDLDRMSSTAVTACQAKLSGVRNMIRQRGAPADWHFVVVCDEAAWKDYASLTGASPHRLVNAAFHTDTELRWTFVRGSRLDATGNPVPTGYPADASPENQLPPARPSTVNNTPLIAGHALPQPKRVITASSTAILNAPFAP